MKNSKNLYEDFNPHQVNMKYSKPKSNSRKLKFFHFYTETKTSLLVPSSKWHRHLHLLYFDRLKFRFRPNLVWNRSNIIPKGNGLVLISLSWKELTYFERNWFGPVRTWSNPEEMEYFDGDGWKEIVLLRTLTGR